MKNFKIYLLLSVSLLIFYGCKQLSKLTKFDLPLEKSVDLPEMPLAIPVPVELLDLPPLETEYETTLKQYGVSKDNVDIINIKKITMSLNSPEEIDFSYIKSIEVAISAGELPKKRIAYKTSIPENIGQIIEFDVDKSVDLKEYIFAGSVNLHITLSTLKPTPAQNITLLTIFNVDAKILGL